MKEGRTEINTLRPRQNGRHFPDDIFKCIFLNENIWISLKIPLKFVPRGPINNSPALVQIMAWRRPGDKPLSEPMLVFVPTHICVTRPQWVNMAIKWDNWFFHHSIIKVYALRYLHNLHTMLANQRLWTYSIKLLIEFYSHTIIYSVLFLNINVLHLQLIWSEYFQFSHTAWRVFSKPESRNHPIVRGLRK